MKTVKECVEQKLNGKKSVGKQLRLISHFKKLPSDGSFQMVSAGSVRSVGSDIEVLDGTFSELRPINAGRKKHFLPKHHSTPAYSTLPAPTYEDISEAESLNGSIADASDDVGSPSHTSVRSPADSPAESSAESPARSPLNLEVNETTSDTINDTQEDEENIHVAEIDNFLGTFMKRKLDRKAELEASLKKYRRKIRGMEREMVDLDAAIQKGRAILGDFQ